VERLAVEDGANCAKSGSKLHLVYTARDLLQVRVNVGCGKTALEAAQSRIVFPLS